MYYKAPIVQYSVMNIYEVPANLFPSLVVIVVALYATAVVLMAMCFQLAYSVN